MPTRPVTAPLLSDQARATLIGRFGSQVSAWCDELPRLVAAITADWRLRVRRVLPAGGTSVVLLCHTDDDDPVVLKLTPDPEIAAAEQTALDAWCDSPYVVALLDADIDRGALLLEALHPGASLHDEPAAWSLPDIAPLLTNLWSPRPTGITGWPDLRERVEFIFDLTERRIELQRAATEDLPRQVIDDSRAYALTLACDGPITLLHGDLHLGNVLRDRRGLVAIDPRPCIGDRNFDAVDWALAGATSRDDIDRNIDTLAHHVPALDPMRTSAWCQAIAAVIATSILARDPHDRRGQFLARLAADTA